MKASVLIIDDEKVRRVPLEAQLKEEGYEVTASASGFEALEYLKEQEFDAIICDLKMPGMDGITFLRELRSVQIDVPVIIVTAYGTIESAVMAMKEGAFDYLTRPYPHEELSTRLFRAIEIHRKMRELEELRRRLGETYQFSNLVGKSHAMKMVFERIRMVAESDVTVLIVGETGTGKELVANAIHENSPRRKAPFMALNCAALSPTLLESELFGHEVGAFTGATRQKRGRFELANKGTLFLDEVDDIPLEVQVKLLRVLETKRFERVGGEKTIETDIRIISATKKDLEVLVREGRFREDLYYRLNVVRIDIPPLRDRKEDILLLIEHFCSCYCRSQEEMKRFSPEALHMIMEYSWPGNVRELENFVKMIYATHPKEIITPNNLPEKFRRKDGNESPVTLRLEEVKGTLNLPKLLNDIEQQCIVWAMKKSRGNQVQAAELLSMPRSTLRDKLALMNLTPKS